MDVEKDPFDGTFDSLETLADTISEVLRCPVTIEDANHRLLAYSSHDTKTDPARIATIIGRRVPEKVINSLWRAGVIPQLLNSDNPIRIPAIHDVGLGNRVAVAIRTKSEILGYIWVLEEDHPLSEEALHQLKKAAQAAKTKLLQLQVRKRKQEAGHQEFLWQLLTGHLKSDTLIRDHAKKLLLALPDRFQVLVFEFTEDISESLQQKIQYLLTATQRIRIVCHAVDRNQLILLASPLNDRSYKQDFSHFIGDFTAQMQDRFRVSPIEAGCGSLFHQDYTKVETSYQEALTVLQLKKRFPTETKALHHVEDLGFYRYLPLIADYKRSRQIENPHLKRLQEYDREHNTSLLQTLAVFLASDSNVKEAADRLHIHANTLNYRLTRIAEIGGINLKDMDQKVSLYLDLKAETLDG
ncbi:PucR family transcriptional regulator [Effusibacillus pohliae]|uniref:PucR family transcriptional regulator n=1 Tax=Effusibacillus pohliae TaxID=232270 RepID=UPI000367867F|nr:PucR family transcriptional regulator [Effusibacillus pohliae]